jgi:hypothetical protein
MRTSAETFRVAEAFKMILRAIYFFGISIGMLQLASGQQSAPSPPESPDQTKQAHDKEQSQRMLGVLPQFGVTNEKHPAPMNPHQKFQLFYRSTLDPAEFAIIGLEAGISQANNSFAEYGQGGLGYAKRYGAAFGDQVSSNFFGNFAYPVLLKQDPRYFRKGDGPFKSRFVYALEQEFVGHRDGGARTFNWPTTLGALTAGSISNAYYPESDRGFGLTLSRTAVSLLYGSLAGVASEFWPDIAQRLHRHKQNSVPGDQPQKQ